MVPYNSPAPPMTAREQDISLDACSTPASIEARSFAIIDAEAGEPKPFTGKAWTVARRLVHTAGDLTLLKDLWLPDRAIEAGLNALKRGAPVFTDTEMARSGIPMRRLEPLGVKVACLLDSPELAREAVSRGITRARAGMEALGDRIGGAVIAIGNAPTALLSLLDCIASGSPVPALVVGMPVGFVNAAESKELLLRHREIPSLVIRGRRGGSPLAAATVNALAQMVLDERK